MSQAWGEGKGGAPADWKSNRLGADFPQTLVELRQASHDSVLSAAGVPAALFSARSGATGAREALRQFLHSTLQPLASVIAVEARAKPDPAVTFDFSRLMAADIQGKARSAKALIDAGFSLEQAAAMAGFIGAGDR